MVALKDGAKESLKDVHLITVAMVTAFSDSLLWVVAHLPAIPHYTCKQQERNATCSMLVKPQVQCSLFPSLGNDNMLTTPEQYREIRVI